MATLLFIFTYRQKIKSFPHLEKLYLFYYLIWIYVTFVQISNYVFQDLEEREWLALHYEQLYAEYEQYLSNDNRKQIAELLIKSQAWDNFMATKFPTVKRYGGEGAESLLAFFWQLLRNSVQGKLCHFLHSIIISIPAFFVFHFYLISVFITRSNFQFRTVGWLVVTVNMTII